MQTNRIIVQKEEKQKNWIESFIYCVKKEWSCIVKTEEEKILKNWQKEFERIFHIPWCEYNKRVIDLFAHCQKIGLSFKPLYWHVLKNDQDVEEYGTEKTFQFCTKLFFELGFTFNLDFQPICFETNEKLAFQQYKAFFEDHPCHVFFQRGNNRQLICIIVNEHIFQKISQLPSSSTFTFKKAIERPEMHRNIIKQENEKSEFNRKLDELALCFPRLTREELTEGLIKARGDADVALLILFENVQNREKIERKAQKGVEIDFFSELLFDFVQYDLFDPYLNDRLPELVLISAFFQKLDMTKGNTTTSNSIVNNINKCIFFKKIEENQEKSLLDRFFWFAPILEEVLEICLKEHKIYSLYSLTYTTFHQCLCMKCKNKEKKFQDFRTYLGIPKSYPSIDEKNPEFNKLQMKEKCLDKIEFWIDILRIIRCPHLASFYILISSESSPPMLRAAVFLRDFEIIDLWIQYSKQPEPIDEILISCFGLYTCKLNITNKNEFSVLVQKIMDLYSRRTKRELLGFKANLITSIFFNDLEEFKKVYKKDIPKGECLFMAEKWNAFSISCYLNS